MRRRAEPLFVWRKLSPAKWEDVWWERLAWMSDRLAITAFATRRTLRLEGYQLTRREADQLVREFGGSVQSQKKRLAAHQPVARAPIRIRKKLLIVATERERSEGRRANRDRPILYIPPGMAFGTGDHETTATALRLLADLSGHLPGGSWDALDLGTGTAVLAMAARIFGARSVTAFDADPAAVRIACEKSRRIVSPTSSSAGRISVSGVPRPSGASFSRISSAISWPRAPPKIAAALAPGGKLIFSGVLREQEAEVVAAFRRAQLRTERIIRKTKWVTGVAMAERWHDAGRAPAPPPQGKNPLTASATAR